MGLEAGTYIDDLNASNPTTGDPRSEGDDHIRLIKNVLLNTFPNITGALSPTHTELNYVNGVTSAIQTQLDSKGAGGDDIPATTHMLFYEATAPTGWSQDVTNNDKAIRIVSGTGAGSGGSVGFETAFKSHSVSGTTDSHVLTSAEIPAHTHTVPIWTIGGAGGVGQYVNGGSGTINTGSYGGGGGHTHGFSAAAIDIDVNYINIITCTKD